MTTDWSLIGVWLLVVGVVIIAIESALAGVWSVRLARRAQEMNLRLNTERGLIRSDLARLRKALAETVLLWQPYRRLLRFLSHPLVMALLQSYARRRAAAR